MCSLTVVCRICLLYFVCKYVYLICEPCWRSRLNIRYKHCVISKLKLQSFYTPPVCYVPDEGNSVEILPVLDVRKLA